jgi:hypothetical protein
MSNKVSSLGAVRRTDEENGELKVTPSDFSPPQQILLYDAQSPEVHLQKEFDDVNGYNSDDGPCHDALEEEGPLIVDEQSILDYTVTPVEVDVVAEIVDTKVVPDRFVLITVADINEMKVTELMDKLEKGDYKRMITSRR